MAVTGVETAEEVMAVVGMEGVEMVAGQSTHVNTTPPQQFQPTCQERCHLALHGGSQCPVPYRLEQNSAGQNLIRISPHLE